MATERPLERGRRAIVDDLVGALDPVERRARDAEAGAEQAAVVLAAHRAVAMREPPVRRCDGERYRAAEAGTADARAHAFSCRSAMTAIVGSKGCYVQNPGVLRCARCSLRS